MTLREAYRVLNLVSPMEFHGIHAQRHGGAWRRGGATTLMVVKAALAVMGGNSVLLVGRERSHANSLGRLCADHLSVLDPGLPQIRQGERIQVSHPTGGMLYIDSVAERARSWATRGRDPATIFSDSEHADLLGSRQPPYTTIAVLEPQIGGYKAFDLFGEFLLELTEEGGQEVLDLDSRVLVRDP